MISFFHVIVSGICFFYFVTPPNVLYFFLQNLQMINTTSKKLTLWPEWHSLLRSSRTIQNFIERSTWCDFWQTTFEENKFHLLKVQFIHSKVVTWVYLVWFLSFFVLICCMAKINDEFCKLPKFFFKYCQLTLPCYLDWWS